MTQPKPGVEFWKKKKLKSRQSITIFKVIIERDQYTIVKKGEEGLIKLKSNENKLHM